ncbi:MAG: aminodeoxychorismate/anthranilate synthase component II [Acidobacteria bacterium]|nr:aminodeoxychorismate/anthranilate synthase component II [Acidobacteriota bacterium]
MVFVLDNYDSFTFNLVQYLGELGVDVVVRRNDRVTVDEVMALRPRRIVISPGPGRPEDAGITVDLIRRCGTETPILGVCLGHQAIGYAFGGRVVRAPRPMHGKTSSIEHDRRGVFVGLPTPLTASRYHSLIVAEDPFPQELEISARSKDEGIIMALRHRTHPLHGVQFHPESILTTNGRQMLRNFLEASS